MATTAPDRTAPETAAEACPECLLGNLSWLLAQSHYALASELTAAFEPLRVSPRGHSVLSAALTGEHTQSELAEMVGLDKTTLVVTLDDLEEAGFAERRPSETDRRARVIAVTDAGKREVASGERIIAEIQADVLDALPEPDRTVFVEALSRLVSTRLTEPVACRPGVRRREPRGRGRGAPPGA
jgi:DNA-binding MarR family transcriptional regulator